MLMLIFAQVMIDYFVTHSSDAAEGIEILPGVAELLGRLQVGWGCKVISPHPAAGRVGQGITTILPGTEELLGRHQARFPAMPPLNLAVPPQGPPLRSSYLLLLPAGL